MKRSMWNLLLQRKGLCGRLCQRANHCCKARLGRFETIADFDWNWPKKIDRQLIESGSSLDIKREGRNLIQLGVCGPVRCLFR